MRLPQFIRSFWYGLENLWRWFPVIWNDRDWDHHFLLKILETKLDHMETFFNSDNPIICEASEVAMQIGIAKRACSRLIEDNVYHDMAFKEHDERWGKIEISSKPSTDEWEILDVQDDLGRTSRLNVRTYKGRPNFHQMIISRSRCKPEEEAEENESSRQCYKIVDELKQFDKETCFDTIRDKYSWWWD